MADENWVPIADMARIVGLTVPQFRALHERLKRPCQEKRGDGKTSPVYVETAGWIGAYLAAGKNEPSATELRGKKKQEFYEGETAEAKYLALIRQLIPIAEVEGVFGEIASELSVALSAVERTNPQVCDRIMVALDSAKEKIERRFGSNDNGHATQTGGARSGDQADRTRKAIPTAKPKGVRRARGHHSNG